MRISLTDVVESNQEPIVRFDCEYGAAVAWWIGKEPAPNDDYDVELDCDESLIENSNFTRSDSANPRIWMDGQVVHLTMSVEGVHEETRTATLRLGDSLMLIDYEGAFPSAGTWIELNIGELRLNDIGA